MAKFFFPGDDLPADPPEDEQERDDYEPDDEPEFEDRLWEHRHGRD